MLSDDLCRQKGQLIINSFICIKNVSVSIKDTATENAATIATRITKDDQSNCINQESCIKSRQYQLEERKIRGTEQIQ